MPGLRPLALLLFLPSCAGAVYVGAPSPVEVGQATAGTGRIRVSRGDAEAGFVANVATTPEIRLDGAKVGTCTYGKPLVLNVPAGGHQVTATGNGSASQWVVVAPGSLTELRCGTAAAPALNPAATLERTAP